MTTMQYALVNAQSVNHTSETKETKMTDEQIAKIAKLVSDEVAQAKADIRAEYEAKIAAMQQAQARTQAPAKTVAPPRTRDVSFFRKLGHVANKGVNMLLTPAEIVEVKLCNEGQELMYKVSSVVAQKVADATTSFNENHGKGWGTKSEELKDARLEAEEDAKTQAEYTAKWEAIEAQLRADYFAKHGVKA